MPGKHVHFAQDSYGGDSTPSPSYSSSSLPSSKGLITPPFVGYGSPYIHLPTASIDATLHPALSVNAGQVVFDLSLPPSHIKLVPGDVPATTPPVSFMTITCAQLPWTITIKPPSETTGYLTVRDVFAMLYNALRVPVTAAEYAMLPNSGAQEAVNRAFRMRCSRDGGEEMKKGLKRIDFLGGKTRFCGLRPAKTGGWILEVS